MTDIELDQQKAVEEELIEFGKTETPTDAKTIHRWIESHSDCAD